MLPTTPAEAAAERLTALEIEKLEKLRPFVASERRAQNAEYVDLGARRVPLLVSVGGVRRRVTFMQDGIVEFADGLTAKYVRVHDAHMYTQVKTRLYEGNSAVFYW